MATIKKIVGSKGISYKITVSGGRTKEGKQVRHYMTFKPPDGMKESRADKEAARAALQFEEKLAQGYQVDNRISFEEYAEYFLGVKQRQGLKKSTSDRYRLLLRRIVPAIGHMKLQDIRPHHLNSFYENLMEPGIRQQPRTAKMKVDLSVLMQKQKISQEKLAKAAHIAPSTIRKLREGGSIQAEKAELIAAALGESAEKLFEYKTNNDPLGDKSCLEHHRLIRSVLGLAEKELIVPYNAASKATPPKVRKPKINNGVDILSVSKRLGHAQTSTTLNFYSHILQQADARSAECIADVLLRKPTEKDGM